MSHSIDLDGISEKLILLQHYSLGSKKYCEERFIGGAKDTGNYELDKYWSWTKGIVSNYILECSIKLRVIQDTFRKSSQELKLFDGKACKNLTIGIITTGNFKLNLRETSNKIIPALNVKPIWIIVKTEKSDFQYWTGEFELSGNHNGKDWVIKLNVYEWAKAFENFIELFESSELEYELGQDFLNSNK